MESSLRPPPGSRRRMRPWYLLAAMVLTWCVGVYGVTTGCSVMVFLRSGSMTDMSTVMEGVNASKDPVEFVAVVYETARMVALSEIRAIAFPLHVAKFLLAGLLAMASGFALGGRPGARTLALQALAANLVLGIVDYGLTPTVRTACVDAIFHAGELLPSGLPERDAITNRQLWWWVERLRFAVIHLGIFGVAVVALTRPRSRLYFDAMAEAAEQAEEP